LPNFLEKVTAQCHNSYCDQLVKEGIGTAENARGYHLVFFTLLLHVFFGFDGLVVKNQAG
jgi:hypothetical protein